MTLDPGLDFVIVVVLSSLVDGLRAHDISGLNSTSGMQQSIPSSEKTPIERNIDLSNEMY